MTNALVCDMPTATLPQEREKGRETLAVVVDRSLFLKALSHQQGLIEKRSTVPILTHVLLEAKDGILSLTGTDMDKSLVVRISAIVHQEGRVTVPAHVFYDIIRKMPEGAEVHLTSKEDRLEVKSGSVVFELVTLAPESFPEIHPQALPFELILPGKELRQMIEDTSFCMSTDDMRLSLSGIHFHSHEGQLRAVATDSHRLALKWLNLNGEELKNMPPVIIGAKTIHNLKKLLEEYEQQHVKFSLSAQQMMVSFSGCFFSSRLLEGQFPAYAGAIPTPTSHFRTIYLDVKTVAQAVGRVGMVNFERHNVIKFYFRPGKVELSASSAQYGSAVEQCNAGFEGDPLVLGFPPRYMLDLCQHMKGDTMVLHIQDSVSPVLFQDLGDEHISFVLMPVRV